MLDPWSEQFLPHRCSLLTFSLEIEKNHFSKTCLEGNVAYIVFLTVVWFELGVVVLLVRSPINARKHKEW